MSVKIRLSRIGKKHVPFYKLVAIDSRKPRDGAYLANIGTFDGLEGKIIVFHEELYNEWIAKGALPSDAAKRIFKLYKQQNKVPAQKSVASASREQQA